MLLATAFLSYVGALDAVYRITLWKDTAIPDLKSRDTPLTDGIVPILLLTTDGNTVKMLSEELPVTRTLTLTLTLSPTPKHHPHPNPHPKADKFSIKNGAIINKRKRLSLTIDPQLQTSVLVERESEAVEGGDVSLVTGVAGGGESESIVAVASEGLLLIGLTLIAKRKRMLATNLEGVRNIGCTSCTCTSTCYNVLLCVLLFPHHVCKQ